LWWYSNPDPRRCDTVLFLGLDAANRSTEIADRLKGKVALVVGAGSVGPGWGNGKATAVAFARERRADILC
jgi:hypothetical protein